MAKRVTEKTVPKQLTPFAPGQSGNPTGRPKGSRNKLGEAFIQALYDDFTEHGVTVIQQVRAEDPVAYVKVCAGILPKEVRISDASEMSEDDLNVRIRQLAAALDLSIGDEGGTAEAAGGTQAAVRKH